jgi:hypothetical protein
MMLRKHFHGAVYASRDRVGTQGLTRRKKSAPVPVCAGERQILPSPSHTKTDSTYPVTAIAPLIMTEALLAQQKTKKKENLYGFDLQFF